MKKTIITVAATMLSLSACSVFANIIGFADASNGTSGTELQLSCNPQEFSSGSLSLQADESIFQNVDVFFGGSVQPGLDQCTVTLYGWTKENFKGVQLGTFSLSFTKSPNGDINASVTNPNLRDLTKSDGLGYYNNDNQWELLTGSFTFVDNAIPGIYFTDSSYT